ncbi:RmlC-like cupin domain-containing protein [Hyaloraphidium curvatum]|nr:RmlC-like cupin domain-containing protein [Hyaloraphidium curvatum]
MSLLDEANAPLPASPALPPLRAQKSFRYQGSPAIVDQLASCQPCVVNGEEFSIQKPPAVLSALYRELDSIFREAPRDQQKALITAALARAAGSIKPADYELYRHWCEEHYTRNLVGATEDFEMIVICWKDRQKSRIHNHAGGRCFVACFEGPLTETLYRNFLDRSELENNDPANLKVVDCASEDIVEIGRADLRAGDTAYIDDSLGLHAMSADAGQDCVTLHVYSPPIRVSTVIEPENAVIIQRLAGFWSYGGKLLAH